MLANVCFRPKADVQVLSYSTSLGKDGIMKKALINDAIASAIYLLCVLGIVAIEVSYSPWEWLKYLYFFITLVFFIGLPINHFIHTNNIASIFMAIIIAVIIASLIMVIGVNFKFMIGGSL